jgi:hypothetical protein
MQGWQGRPGLGRTPLSHSTADSRPTASQAERPDELYACSRTYAAIQAASNMVRQNPDSSNLVRTYCWPAQELIHRFAKNGPQVDVSVRYVVRGPLTARTRAPTDPRPAVRDVPWPAHGPGPDGSQLGCRRSVAEYGRPGRSRSHPGVQSTAAVVDVPSPSPRP